MDSYKNRGYRHPLHVAAKYRNLPEIERLLSQGVYVNVRNENNLTALHVASNHIKNDSHLSTIELLLKNGADANAQDQDGHSVLQNLFSSKKLNIKSVELLFSYNADVNIKDDWGQTPLHEVCNFNVPETFEVVKLLVYHGADINIVDKGKSTPLLLASKNYNEKVFKFLVKNGGDLNFLDFEDESPLLRVLWGYYVSEKDLTYFF